MPTNSRKKKLPKPNANPKVKVKAKIKMKKLQPISALPTAPQHPAADVPLAPVASRPPRLNKEVSVMAWIEDAYGDLLMVKQKPKRGKPGLWSFPGGKVLAGESLRTALERELLEEMGVEVDVAAPLDVFDRPERSSFTMLYRVILKRGKLPQAQAEIEKALFRKSLPKNSTPSAQYFWQRAQYCFEPLHVFDARTEVPKPLGEEEE
ncbi:MAG: NUDIX hydrolase [Candidatus Methylacidiphilales bacterium]|nr:NUDIX hydrolase [Candidatus Methylacidiphilales bacterium]